VNNLSHLKEGDLVYVLFGGKWHAATVTLTRDHSLTVRPGHVQVRIHGITQGNFQIDQSRVNDRRPEGRL